MAARTEVVIVGMKDVQEGIKQISNILTTEGVQTLLWDTGITVRESARRNLLNAVYRTAESKNYKRTRFLFETIYVSTAHRNDYAECYARGFALAIAVYPHQQVKNTYRMAPLVEAKKLEVQVISGSVYSDFVEFGNGKVGPRPFMRLTVEKAHPVAVQSVDNYVRQYLSRAAQRARRSTGGQFMSRYG